VVKSADTAAEALDDPTVNVVLTVLRMCRVLERTDAGLSPQQYRILKLIGAGGERSARLAEQLAVARPTVTATADSLVAAGLASREAEPGDRRVVRLRLTDAGQAAVVRADAAYVAWMDSLLDHTGHRDEILASFALLDESMNERRRARLEADAAAKAGRGDAGAKPGRLHPAGATATAASAGPAAATRSAGQL
jgi:DNA-binding MarR family transcriptional regulator